MQEFHKKLTKSNIKSQGNSTYIFINFQQARIITKIPQNYQEMCMKIFRIFKEFLDTKTYENFTIFNKNSKQLTRKYHTFFNQDLTHDNITKISRK
jgi:hypothetical protein